MIDSLQKKNKQLRAAKLNKLNELIELCNWYKQNEDECELLYSYFGGTYPQIIEINDFSEVVPADAKKFTLNINFCSTSAALTQSYSLISNRSNDVFELECLFNDMRYLIKALKDAKKSFEDLNEFGAVCSVTGQGFNDGFILFENGLNSCYVEKEQDLIKVLRKESEQVLDWFNCEFERTEDDFFENREDLINISNKIENKSRLSDSELLIASYFGGCHYFTDFSIDK